MMRTARICFLSLFLLALTHTDGCNCHGIEPPRPPSVIGNYGGTYSRVVQGTDSNLVHYMTWIFTDKLFYMDYDTTHYPNIADAQACDVGGNYEIGAGITLVANSAEDSSRTERICTISYAPFGMYQFNQSVEGEITMTCLTQNPQGKSVIRTIHLIKKP